MAHKAQMQFIKKVKKQFKHYFHHTRVLEIGSYNINGTVRDFFKYCEYTGIDVAPGYCVDIVCPGEKYDAPDDYFDVCLSCECFEHNPKWIETFQNMLRMTRSTGLILFTCATTGRPEHGTVNIAKNESLTTSIKNWETYYRNLSEEDFRNEFDFSSLFSNYTFITNIRDCDLYFFGILK
jgi:SAM-dependent methyltransferase